MAVDIFLRLDTILGESINPMFKGQIPLHAVTSGLRYPVMIGSGLRDEHATVSPLVVTKWVDSTSVLLAKALVTGAKLASGRISFLRTGAGPEPLVFLTMDLKPVFVTDIQSVTSGDELPAEQVTLAVSQIVWTHTRQNQDGSTSQTRYGWNFATNSAI